MQVTGDVDMAQRLHAIAHGELETAELVEAQHMHHQAQRRSVHEQGEQHEQDGEQCDEVAEILRQALVAGGDHGQHDGDGAAQAAPDQDRLVAFVDRLDEFQGLQHRQHAEDDQAARREGADRHRQHAPDIEPGDLQQNVGRHHRGQHEDQAVRPELKLRPDLAQRRPLPRMEVGRPIGRNGERRHHHGHHAGNMQVAVGNDE